MQNNLRIRNMLMLARLALLVWACWLGLLLLLGGQLVGRVWHPNFLPVTAMLVLMLTAGLALVIGAGWRLARGPKRRQALSYLLLGLAPMLFLSSLIAFGVSMVSGHQTPLNLGTKLLVTMCESILDLVARFQYPQRTYGRRNTGQPLPGATDTRAGRRACGMAGISRRISGRGPPLALRPTNTSG